MSTEKTQEVGGSATPPPHAVSANPVVRKLGGIKHKAESILLPLANKLTETATSSMWFRKMVKKAFDDFDLDKNGSLNASELFACLLKIYDEVNFRLPTHVMGPTRSEVTALMKKYDVNASGGLEFDEFLKLARNIMGVTSLTYSIPINCAVIILLRLVMLPFIAGLILTAAKAIGGWASLLAYPGVGIYVIIMEMVLRSWWVSVLKPL